MKVKELVEILLKENQENDVVISAVFPVTAEGIPIAWDDENVEQLAYDEEGMDVGIQGMSVGETDKSELFRGARKGEKVVLVEAW